MAESKHSKRPPPSVEPRDKNDLQSDGEEGDDEYLVPRKRTRSEHKPSSEAVGRVITFCVCMVHDRLNPRERISLLTSNPKSNAFDTITKMLFAVPDECLGFAVIANLKTK